MKWGEMEEAWVKGSRKHEWQRQVRKGWMEDGIYTGWRQE